MLKRIFTLISIPLSIGCLKAQVTDKVITSWWFNTTNQTFTGTNGTIKVNVESVYYTSTLAYIKSSGIPSYYADGVTGVNGNKKPKFDGKDQTNVFILPRTPTVGTAATRIYLRDQGAMAVLIDGSVALTPCDGKSYNSASVWHQIAYKFEGNDFDSYNGHSTPGGQYHHHVDPNSLYTVSASSTHSPIIGFAFDGYPIYGPYGYTNTNGTGAIKRMTPSWAIRNITSRTTLPDGSTAASSGPTIATTALGYYFEDYAYTASSGDLDQYNGRICVTPEYPSGTYCYFLTLDAALKPVFPYFVGDYHYGAVQSGNMGTTGGNNTVPANATLYSSALPVELTRFEAQAKECSVELVWSSASELRFKHYEVEYSADGKNFKTVQTIPAQGSGTRYNYNDNPPSVKVAYYRLKMIDNDGSYQYSPVASMVIDCIFNKINIKTYPNPVVNVLTIDGLSGKNTKIRLYNALGIVIQTANVTSETHSLDMSSLLAGNYVVEIIDNTTGNGLMKKVVKR